MSRLRRVQIPQRPADPWLFDARVVAPEGRLTPKAYLVGEAPGCHEADAGRPFVDPQGRPYGYDARSRNGCIANPPCQRAPFPPHPAARSKTDRPSDEFSRIYDLAYDLQLKGGTTFRPIPSPEWFSANKIPAMRRLTVAWRIERQIRGIGE